MIALLKKFWYIPAGLVLGLVLALTVRHHPSPGKPDAVQLAAQHAAGAIVQTEHADSALARHQVSAVSVGVHIRHARTAQRAVDSLQHAEAPPAQIIAAQDTVIAQQDTAVTVLVTDNAQLAATLHQTRDSLSEYRTPVVPVQAIAPPHSSFLATIGHAALSNVTIGYGAVYDGHAVTFGPSATAGVHLTSGAIGVTAGASLGYANGLHAGVGINVGVRL